jgi:cyanophycinase
MTHRSGTLALVGGDEWTDKCRPIDELLLGRAGTRDVVVIPAAAAFEHPQRAVDRATQYFEKLGAHVEGLQVVNRRDAQADANVSVVRAAKFVYIADGSPLHLRSVLKGSALYGALEYAYRDRGAVVAASGASATVLCDPMVDPRGGAYTVGLGLVSGFAIFPYHGTAADHLRERSIDLLSPNVALVGVDEQTAIVLDNAGTWTVAGAGRATIYRRNGKSKSVKAGGTLDLAAAVTTR